MSLPSFPASNKPNLNPMPGDRFRDSPNSISEHRAMVESRPFQRAVDFAMLEYQAVLAREVQSAPTMAAGQGFKLCGVYEFIAVLKTISETPAIIRPVITGNLDHSIRK